MRYLWRIATLAAIAIGGWFIAGALKSSKEETAWLPLLGLLIEILGKVDWLNALLLMTAAIVIALLLIAQFTPGDGFDMRSMFAKRDIDHGRELWTVEPGRVYQTGAFGLTTWAMVWLVTHDKLTETFMLGYVALWAGSRALNQIIASKFPVQPGTTLEQLTPTQPAVVTTTTTEIKNP